MCSSDLARQRKRQVVCRTGNGLGGLQAFDHAEVTAGQRILALRFSALRIFWGAVGMSARGDEMACGAPDRGQLRTSHADREQVVATLKAALVQGRLSKNEFDQRIEQVLASRTYADLTALTADLPARLAEAHRPGPTAPLVTSPPVNKPLLWGSWAIVIEDWAALSGHELHDAFTGPANHCAERGQTQPSADLRQSCLGANQELGG